MSKIPLTVFTYNHLEHTRQMLDSFAAYSELEDSNIYIYGDAQIVEAVGMKIYKSYYTFAVVRNP